MGANEFPEDIGCELKRQEIFSQLLQLSPPTLCRLKIYCAKTPLLNKGVSLAVDFNTAEHTVNIRNVFLNNFTEI